jgi:general secretion pathway protein E/type IV pilus assembly protein PilB
LGDRPLYRKVGCRECRHVGYSGRMGIYELLLTDNNIRQLAHDRSSTWKIKQAAVRQGMRTLRDDGWTKAMDGTTTVDEVLRITKGDQDLAELDKLLH